MQCLRSDDAEIAYQIEGTGPPVVLLHPFPVHHEFWDPIVPTLASRYRVIRPDLRGHGESDIGEGPAFMSKHAADLVKLMDAAGIGKAVFVGCSIGGYILFEFWRRYRDRVSALAICDSRPQPDTPEGRAGRLKSAADVLELGTGQFLETMIPRLMGRTTLSRRPDLVANAHAMMREMSAEDVSLVQRGMADRPDSVGDLKTINVPTLVMIGEEDILSTVADGELMRQQIPGSQLRVIPKAGHYSPYEQPGAVGALLRQFLDVVHGA
jgi:pimeloyl-ACP methyl ester carboxylesterase